MITIKAGIVISGIFVLTAMVRWFMDQGRQKKEGFLLDFAAAAGEREREEQDAIRRQREKEEEEQARKAFGLDFLITHGGAFGGCSATCPDGRLRKGSVRLDQIMMYGQQVSGKDYTYYIEDQGLTICAGDSEDHLFLKSADQSFEIREAGLDRDQGITTDTARISRDVLYYVILESHHEISIKATARC